MNGQGEQRGYLPQAQAGAARRGLVRPRRGRMVAGVLAGLARRFGISPLAARLVFLVTLLLPGPQFIAYIVLWVLMPNEG
jgi:phage shock protein C